MILIRKIRTLFFITMESIFRFKSQRKIVNKDFTIISNNCWGGCVYEDLGLPYTTPTVGLFFHGPCYLKFLKNLKCYLSCDLTFVKTSKYDIANQKRKYSQLFYPIGLAGDVEIHFLHYHSVEEATEKWTRRRSRVNYNNLFVEMGENELVDLPLMQEFDLLDYPNKLLFSSKNYQGLNSQVWLKDRKDFPDIGDIYTNRQIWRKEFDVVKWLNNGIKQFK